MHRSTDRLTERKAWTISALMELRGLSLMTTKICSSFSRLMKFPNQDLLVSLSDHKHRHTDTWIICKTHHSDAAHWRIKSWRSLSLIHFPQIAHASRHDVYEHCHLAHFIFGICRISLKHSLLDVWHWRAVCNIYYLECMWIELRCFFFHMQIGFNWKAQ